MKKLLSVISVILVFSLLFSFVGYCTDDKLNYLVIGDSIGRGAGVLNPDEACYGLMVANTNGYNFTNDAIDGSRSDDLLKLLQTERVINDVKNADIISISIGGNDFLRANILALLFDDIFTKNYDKFTEIQNLFYENFSKIIEIVRQLNPDALILVQTVYNMRHDLLTGVNEKGKNLLNECYRTYLDEHPGEYVIVDVDSVLTGRRDCLALDTIHPNGTGNIEIAKLVLKALKDNGFGESEEPVIFIEPIEQFSFGIKHIIRVIMYYYNYIQTH